MKEEEMYAVWQHSQERAQHPLARTVTTNIHITWLDQSLVRQPQATEKCHRLVLDHQHTILCTLFDSLRGYSAISW